MCESTIGTVCVYTPHTEARINDIYIYSIKLIFRGKL